MEPSFYWTSGASSSDGSEDLPSMPHRDRLEIIEGAKWLYQLIGSNYFEKRFDFFGLLKEQSVLPPTIRDNHPIEYGLYICLKHPEAVHSVPAGYLSWSDTFCGLVQKFRAESTDKREWKGLRGDIISGLGVSKGNHDSLNGVFFELRFGTIFDRQNQFKINLNGSKIARGTKFNITADYVLSTPTSQFAIECKSLRNGPIKSSLDSILFGIFNSSPEIRSFLSEGSGLHLITMPKLDFLKVDGGLENLRHDIKQTMENPGAAGRIFLSSSFHPNLVDSEEIRKFLAENTPQNYSSMLMRSRNPGDKPYTFIEGQAAVACFLANDDEIFAENVKRIVRKVLEKQSFRDKPAIVAFNVDYVTGLRRETKNKERLRADDRASAIYAIQHAVLNDDVCRNIYGVFFWFDQALQSSEVWATDIGIDCVFWKNAHSIYASISIPPPFDQFSQIEYDMTNVPDNQP